MDERQLGYPECGQSTIFSGGAKHSDGVGGGGGGGGHPDPEIRGMPGLKKIFFRPFASQFGLKIRGRPPPLDPPLIFVTVPGDYSPGTKCEGTLTLLLTSHVNLNSNFRIRYGFFLLVYPWP